MHIELVVFIIFLAAAIYFSLSKKKLTPAATIVATVIAIVIYEAFQLTGIALIGTFFLAGIVVTWWNRESEKVFSLQEKEQRDALQVFANGGMALLLSLLTVFYPDFQAILLLMMACAFASATADTVSSELGNIYGRYFYNILSFKKDTRGENGVISFEGTLAGIGGSILIALVYSIAVHFDVSSIIIVIASGTLGNVADSLLGATLERKNIIGNNAVNFLNTFIAAAFGGALSY